MDTSLCWNDPTTAKTNKRSRAMRSLVVWLLSSLMLVSQAFPVRWHHEQHNCYPTTQQRWKQANLDERSGPYRCNQLLHSTGMLNYEEENDYTDDESGVDTINDSTDDRLLSLDPDSPQTRAMIMSELNLSAQQYDQLVKLSHVITELNQNVNLVSRKDCSPCTVFGRHILPCMAVAAIATDCNPLHRARTVVDVGTGGGFPGLVLSILYPSIEFLLVDSVGKKLKAVQEAAHRLGLENVETYHGRAEQLTGRVFDVATGRSVAALPKFCSWMHQLVAKNGGHLLYWIGGDIPTDIHDLASGDVLLRELVPSVLNRSDKRILIFPQSSVKRIAQGEIAAQQQEQQQQQQQQSRRTSFRDTWAGQARNGKLRQGESRPNNSNQRRAKGEWKKKDPNAPKQRGYDNFRRFSTGSRSDTTGRSAAPDPEFR